MTERECDDFLTSILIIAKRMLQFGAEVRRVEDTISRIFRAYKIESSEIYAYTLLIVVTVKTSSGIVKTQSARINTSSNNLGEVENLNNLSRQICSNPPSISNLTKTVNKLNTSFSLGYYNSLGYMFSSGAFCIFFGGMFIDAICSSLIGLIIFFMEKFLKIKDSNKLIYTLIMSTATGVIAILSVSIGFGENLDKIIIGVVMLLIPTLALINGIKDMFYRDIISGLYKVTESILTATTIALGYGIAMVLLGGLLA